MMAGSMFCATYSVCAAAEKRAHRSAHHHREEVSGQETNDRARIRLLGGTHRVEEHARHPAKSAERRNGARLVDTDEQVVYQDGMLKNNREVSMQVLPTKIEDGGGTLLFSDSPEYVQEDGILYQDTVQGEARILYYHLNDSSHAKKLAVVMENANDHTIEVKLKRGGASAPSDDYLAVGKATQVQYFRDSLRESRFIPGGEGRLLRADMGQTILHPGQLVYGVYDFFSEYPVKVSVVMYEPGQNPVEFARRAKVLPKDAQRLRGTFHGMNRKITSRTIYNPMKSGVAYVMIGDDKRDPFREGIDATDGSAVKNVGNYGILYQFALSTARQETRYYLTPFGGVYTGAVRVMRGGQSWLVETPDGLPYYGDIIPKDTQDDVVARENGGGRLQMGAPLAALGTFAGREQVIFEYSPPGASNLPVALVLMP